jgi:hypothetical protein
MKPTGEGGTRGGGGRQKNVNLPDSPKKKKDHLFFFSLFCLRFFLLADAPVLCVVYVHETREKKKWG